MDELSEARRSIVESKLRLDHFRTLVSDRIGRSAELNGSNKVYKEALLKNSENLSTAHLDLVAIKSELKKRLLTLSSLRALSEQRQSYLSLLETFDYHACNPCGILFSPEEDDQHPKQIIELEHLCNVLFDAFPSAPRQRRQSSLPTVLETAREHVTSESLVSLLMVIVNRLEKKIRKTQSQAVHVMMMDCRSQHQEKQNPIVDLCHFLTRKLQIRSSKIAYKRLTSHALTPMPSFKFVNALKELGYTGDPVATVGAIDTEKSGIITYAKFLTAIKCVLRYYKSPPS